MEIKDRKLQWELTPEEVGLIVCALGEIGEKWPQDVRDEAERLTERIYTEFPEVPYVLDPQGYFEREEDEKMVLAWAGALPTLRYPNMECPSPFPVEL